MLTPPLGETHDVISLSLFIACSGKSSDTATADTGGDCTDETQAMPQMMACLKGWTMYWLSQMDTALLETIYLSFPNETEFQFSGDCNSFFGESE